MNPAVIEAPPDSGAPELGYTVAVDAFSGPLDLLLFLVRKSELDIIEIPISTITDQFVALVAAWQRDGDLDLEGAGDFILMAATLLEIKARTIAPPPIEDGDLASEDEDDLLDPRADLIGKLLAYRRFKEAVGLLNGLEAARALRVTRQLREEIPEDPEEATGIDLGDLHVDQLSKLWFTLLIRIGGGGPRTVLKDDLPIEGSIRKLTARAEAERLVTLQQLFAAEDTLQGRISMLMATLECTRQRIVAATQPEQYGLVTLAFREEAERVIVSQVFAPDEGGKKRRRRPPLVTFQARVAPSADEQEDAPDAPETEEKHETDEERFLRELNEACDLDGVLARVVDVEKGFQRYWDELHPAPEPVPVVVPEPVIAPQQLAPAEVLPVVEPVAEVAAALAPPAEPVAVSETSVLSEPLVQGEPAAVAELTAIADPTAIAEPVAMAESTTVIEPAHVTELSVANEPTPATDLIVEPMVAAVIESLAPATAEVTESLSSAAVADRAEQASEVVPTEASATEAPATEAIITEMPVAAQSEPTSEHSTEASATVVAVTEPDVALSAEAVQPPDAEQPEMVARQAVEAPVVSVEVASVSDATVSPDPAVINTAITDAAISDAAITDAAITDAAITDAPVNVLVSLDQPQLSPEPIQGELTPVEAPVAIDQQQLPVAVEAIGEALPLAVPLAVPSVEPESPAIAAMDAESFVGMDDQPTAIATDLPAEPVLAAEDDYAADPAPEPEDLAADPTPSPIAAEMVEGLLDLDPQPDSQQSQEVSPAPEPLVSTAAITPAVEAPQIPVFETTSGPQEGTHPAVQVVETLAAPAPQNLVLPPSRAGARRSQGSAPRLLSRTLFLVLAGTASAALATWWMLREPVTRVPPAAVAEIVTTTTLQAVSPVIPPASVAVLVIPRHPPSPALLRLTSGPAEQWWWQASWPIVVPWTACLPQPAVPESVFAFSAAPTFTGLPVAVFAVDGSWAWCASGSWAPLPVQVLAAAAWIPDLALPVALSAWSSTPDLRAVPVATFAEDLGWTVLCWTAPRWSILPDEAWLLPLVVPASVVAWSGELDLHDVPVTTFARDLSWTVLCRTRQGLPAGE